MYLIATLSLQMCNYKYIEIYDKQVSKEMTLKYILVYHKCLSIFSKVHLFQRKQNSEIT